MFEADALIVKSFLRLIVFGLLGLFALAACLPVTEPAADAVFSADAELFPGANLSLIGSTGRPQFLNGFADW